MTIKELRQITGLSAQKFGDKYHIPLRSIHNWEYGVTKCPDYVLELLEFKVKYDYKIKD